MQHAAKRIKLRHDSGASVDQGTLFLRDLAVTLLSVGALLQDANDDDWALDMYQEGAATLMAASGLSGSTKEAVQGKMREALLKLNHGQQRLASSFRQVQAMEWSDCDGSHEESLSTRMLSKALHVDDLRVIGDDDGLEKHERRQAPQSSCIRGLILHNIGLVFYKRGLVDQATQILEKAMDSILAGQVLECMVPNLAIVVLLNNLAHMYAEVGKHSDAMGILAHGEMIVHQAVAWSTVEEEDFDDSLRALAKRDRGVILSNFCVALMCNKAIVHYREGEHEDTIECFRQATSLSTSSSLFHRVNKEIYRVGFDYQSKGRCEEALEVYRLAMGNLPIYLQMFQTHPCVQYSKELMENIGALYTSMGLHRKAFRVSCLSYKFLKNALGDNDPNVMLMKHSLGAQLTLLKRAESSTTSLAAAAA